jgi:hypothetical protein
MLKIIALLVSAVGLWAAGALVSPAASMTPISLDDLATLELPGTFHLEESAELKLTPARRLLRRPYLRPDEPPGQLTYFLPSHDSQGLGGREVPAVLRVTLYAPDEPLPAAPDDQYLRLLAQQNFHYDAQKSAVYAQARLVTDGLFYTEEVQTKPGWFSVSEYRLMHFILTDPQRKARLFLSVSEQEMSRNKAEQLLRRAMQSLQIRPDALGQHVAYARHVAGHRAEIERANYVRNLADFNQQLAQASLPSLTVADPDHVHYGRTGSVDVGTFFYGINERSEVFFVARLGSGPEASAKIPPYFSSVNPNGRYLLSQTQEAVLRQNVPPGHRGRWRNSVSECLTFPPEEFDRFRVTDMLRETAESIELLGHGAGFAPPVRTAEARWLLRLPLGSQHIPALGEWTDYRQQPIRFPDNTSPEGFTLDYLGERQAMGQPPAVVFTIDSQAGTRYASVSSAQGGTLPVAAGYRVTVEPLAQGRLWISEVE